MSCQWLLVLPTITIDQADPLHSFVHALRCEFGQQQAAFDEVELL